MNPIIKKVQDFLEIQTEILAVQYLPADPVQNPDWKCDILLITTVAREHFQLVLRERVKIEI